MFNNTSCTKKNCTCLNTNKIDLGANVLFRLLYGRTQRISCRNMNFGKRVELNNKKIKTKEYLKTLTFKNLRL